MAADTDSTPPSQNGPLNLSRLEDQSGNVQRIINATIETIATEGVEHARLKDISATVGVSIGTIQYYFKTRDNLIDQALYRYTMDSVDYLRSAATSHDDPWESIVEMMLAYVHRQDGERKARIWISLVNAGMLNVRHLRMLNTIAEEWRKLYRDMIISGLYSGRFKPTADIDDLVELMYGLTDAFAVGQVASVLDYTHKVERLTHVFLGMLKEALNVQE